MVLVFQAPPCNGAAVTEFRLEWGAAEGSMQVCYSGPGLSHEMKGLLPATNYFCRVQVSTDKHFIYFMKPRLIFIYSHW